MGKPKRHLNTTARKLLFFLGENAVISVPRREVYERVVGINPKGLENWRNLLAQYIGQLDAFAEGVFWDSYMVQDCATDTLSVKKSFKNKYFVFITLRSPKK